MAKGVWGQMPHFCQDGALDFFKIDEEIGGGNVVANFQSRGRGQKSSFYAPTFIALATPLGYCIDGERVGKFFNNGSKERIG